VRGGVLFLAREAFEVDFILFTYRKRATVPVSERLFSTYNFLERAALKVICLDLPSVL
jgi:hypothetical protein